MNHGKHAICMLPFFNERRQNETEKRTDRDHAKDKVSIPA